MYDSLVSNKISQIIVLLFISSDNIIFNIMTVHANITAVDVELEVVLLTSAILLDYSVFSFIF